MLQSVIRKTAKIGYESFIKTAAVYTKGTELMDPVPLADFKAHPENYTIVDVRMAAEAEAYKIFDTAISIPLDELRERINEIPLNLPVVVHCAGGYRSAAGSSLIAGALKAPIKIYDLGNAIKQFEP